MPNFMPNFSGFGSRNFSGVFPTLAAAAGANSVPKGQSWVRPRLENRAFAYLFQSQFLTGFTRGSAEPPRLCQSSLIEYKSWVMNPGNLTFWRIGVLTILLMLTGVRATCTDVTAIKGNLLLWYNISIDPTAYALLAETATARLWVKSVAIGVFLQNGLFTMWVFVLPYIFNPDKANLGAKTAFVFCLIYVWFYQPETTMCGHEELDELFVKHVPAR
ncbi:hypothetical protein V1505DRAFT_411203 [Lipomyces doorenjongii]